MQLCQGTLDPMKMQPVFKKCANFGLIGKIANFRQPKEMPYRLTTTCWGADGRLTYVEN